MATFYLGYKREETDTAIALAKEIESLGHTPIFDALAIAPGQNWRDVLLRALSTADAMVPILSGKALNSKFRWAIYIHCRSQKKLRLTNSLMIWQMSLILNDTKSKARYWHKE
jgi:TIR domain